MVVRTKGGNWSVQMLTEDKRSRVVLTIGGQRWYLKQSDAEELAAAIEEVLYAH